MTERPYILDFSPHKDFCLKVIDLLEIEYKQYLARRRGIISIHDLDKKVFPKVVQSLSPLSEDENHIVEALFDSFVGGITMAGSEMAFELIRIQASQSLDFL